jgi:hypothetical protein
VEDFYFESLVDESNNADEDEVTKRVVGKDSITVAMAAVLDRINES